MYTKSSKCIGWYCCVVCRYSCPRTVPGASFSQNHKLTSSVPNRTRDKWKSYIFWCFKEVLINKFLCIWSITNAVLLQLGAQFRHSMTIMHYLPVTITDTHQHFIFVTIISFPFSMTLKCCTKRIIINIVLRIIMCKIYIQVPLSLSFSCPSLQLLVRSLQGGLFLVVTRD